MKIGPACLSFLLRGVFVKWINSVLESVFCGIDKRQSEAVSRLISRDGFTEQDAAHIMHIINTNPIGRLDTMDKQEAQEFIKDVFNIEVSYA